jgi:hypothetical protein
MYNVQLRKKGSQKKGIKAEKFFFSFSWLNLVAQLREMENFLFFSSLALALK